MQYVRILAAVLACLAAGSAGATVVSLVTSGSAAGVEVTEKSFRLDTGTLRVRPYLLPGTTPGDKFVSALLSPTASGVGVCEARTCGSYFEPVDNEGSLEWLLFTFTPFPAARFNSFSLVPATPGDYDTTYYYGEMSQAELDAGLAGQPLARLSQYTTGTSSNLMTVSVNGTGNFLLVGARYPDLDGQRDFFFVQTINLNTIPAIPETSTLILFAAGLALLARLRIRQLS